MAISEAVAHQRAIVASLTRCVTTGERQPDDPQLAEARENLRRATVFARVKRLLADAPPLTNEQIGVVVGLLQAGGGGA